MKRVILVHPVKISETNLVDIDELSKGILEKYPKYNKIDFESHNTVVIDADNVLLSVVFDLKRIAPYKGRR